MRYTNQLEVRESLQELPGHAPCVGFPQRALPGDKLPKFPSLQSLQDEMEGPDALENLHIRE